MAVYMVVLFVEGGTRLSSALSDDDIRQSSNNSDVSLLKKETSNRQKSYSKSYGGSQAVIYFFSYFIWPLPYDAYDMVNIMFSL